MTNDQITTGHQSAARLIEKLHRDEMTNIVRKVLDNQQSSVTGGWKASVVGKSVGPGTVGICIVRGSAETASGTTNWSVVGKVLDLQDTSGMFSGFASPQRELDTYTSGILDTLTGDRAPNSRFRAARFYGLTEMPGQSIVILWIEDLSSAPEPPWDDDVFVTVARHMGHFNGTWLLNPPMPLASFHDDGYRRRFESLVDGSALDYEQHLDDRYVRLAATETWKDGIGWLAGNFRRVLDYFQTTERLLAHVDSQPKNLFPVVAADGQPETVAIDWAAVGYASLGMDVAQLLASPLVWLEIDVSRAQRLEPEIFESYLAGLDDVGWQGDRDTVWLGYMTVATGRSTGATGFPRSWIAHEGMRDQMVRLLGFQPDELVAGWGEVFEWRLPQFRAAVEKAGIA